MGVRKDGILEVTGGGGGGTSVDIINPIGQDTMADSVSVTIASDQTPVPVSISGSITVDEPVTVDGAVEITDGTNTANVAAANVNPVLATDAAIIAAIRDLVTNNQSAISGAGARLLPIGVRDMSNGTLKHIPILSTPWNLDAFGQTAVLTREIGSTASQSSGTLNALNSTLALNCAANNINAVVLSITNTASFVGTVTPRIAASDGVFRNTAAFRLSDGLRVTSLELNTPYIIYTSGYYYFEARVTAYTSGSAVGYSVGTAANAVTYGVQNVIEQASNNSNITSVANSTASVNLLALNLSRLSVIITNEDSVDLFVKLGVTASATSYTKKLSANENWVMPYRYTGVIDGIWASASAGSARITELS